MLRVFFTYVLIIICFSVKIFYMCLDSTNKLEHWYVRHNNVYCLHPWATCFNLYTGHVQALLYMRVHKKLRTMGSQRA